SGNSMTSFRLLVLCGARHPRRTPPFYSLIPTYLLSRVRFHPPRFSCHGGLPQSVIGKTPKVHLVRCLPTIGGRGGVKDEPAVWQPGYLGERTLASRFGRAWSVAVYPFARRLHSLLGIYP